MKILAIDTATEACSAALLTSEEFSDDVASADIKVNIISRYQLAPREHSRLILKMIDEILQQADLTVGSLDAIAFGQGPGSFMGLRIAAGVVQGIAFAHDLPVIAVSTLKAIAQRAFDESGSSNVLATIDARMDEVYWAAYTRQDKKWQLLADESVISPDNIILPELPASAGYSWTGAGNGWANYKERLLKAVNRQSPDILSENLLAECFPNAEVIAKLAVDEFRCANTVSAAQAIPVYIRNNVAKKPKPVSL